MGLLESLMFKNIELYAKVEFINITLKDYHRCVSILLLLVIYTCQFWI